MRQFLTAIICLLSFACSRHSVSAKAVLGVHILHPAEITEAGDLLKTQHNQEQWTYVTLPLSLDDLNKHDEWQAAFDRAAQLKINPIVRLVSRFDSEHNCWAIPTRGEIISYFNFLNTLTWPHEHRFVIIFNEPNHFSEWGGSANPDTYAEVLSFAADWAHTETAHYSVLPAAMDLAAPDGPTTMEAFNFLTRMLDSRPDIFSKIDYWNSHSYPNPGFSSSPTRTGQNSLRGFEHELAWLHDKTGLDMRVFITETGGEENASTKGRLESYYAYANDHIWSDERIVAVTPFVLKGDPGPFSKFTLIDKDGNLKTQYHAYAQQIAKNALQDYQERERIEIASF